MRWRGRAHSRHVGGSGGGHSGRHPPGTAIVTGASQAMGSGETAIRKFGSIDVVVNNAGIVTPANEETGKP